MFWGGVLGQRGNVDAVTLRTRDWVSLRLDSFSYSHFLFLCDRQTESFAFDSLPFAAILFATTAIAIARGVTLFPTRLLTSTLHCTIQYT